MMNGHYAGLTLRYVLMVALVAIPTGNPLRAQAESPTAPSIANEYPAYGDMPISVSISDFVACAISADSALRCWGNSMLIGNGTTSSPLTPTLTGLTRVADVQVSRQFVCALVTPVGAISAGVKCWGYNTYGILGVSPTVLPYSATPRDIPGLTQGVAALTVGEDYACALNTEGGVKCWGLNNAGQLGDGTRTNRSTPVQVAGLASGVRAIDAGWQTSCALLVSGAVSCWGENSYRQILNTATAYYTTPRVVSGLPGNIERIALGGYSTCLLTRSGAVWCWGAVGLDAPGFPYFPPTLVPGLESDVIAIDPGYAHTCAIRPGGSVVCWGLGSNGALGNNTEVEASLVPVDVIGVTGATQLSTGVLNACVRIPPGQLKCWGLNWEGTLGDNSTIDRWTPVDVLWDTASVTGELTSPIDGSQTGPASLLLSANASTVNGNPVTGVEFVVLYDNAWHSLGQDPTAPYEWSWDTLPGLRSQQLMFAIHVHASDGSVDQFAGGARRVNYIESSASVNVETNWVPNRYYLNQNSIQPYGNCRCSASSMAMLLAMAGVIEPEQMAAKVFEMYPNVIWGSGCGTAAWDLIKGEMNRQVGLSNKPRIVEQSRFSQATGWEHLTASIDLGRPVAIRTDSTTMTSSGHIIVVVGYREAGAQRQIIAYDPFGRWQGALNSYDYNSTSPNSHKGQWVYYDFAAVFGNSNIMMSVHSPDQSTSADSVAAVPSSPPDVTSAEPETVGIFQGVQDGFRVLLPTIRR